MKNILVATDFSNEGDRGVMRAVKLASRFNARISLLHVVECEPAEQLAAEAKALSQMEDITCEIRDFHNVTCTPLLANGSVAPAIAATADKIGAELLVLGMRDRGALQSMLPGTTVDRTARMAKIPLLVVKAEPDHAYRLGLAAIDFTDCSRRAIAHALQLGILRHSRVVVLHVFDVMAKGVLQYIGVGREKVEGYVAEVSTRALRDTRAFLEEVNFGAVSHSVLLKEGKPAETIHQVAHTIRPDVIVIGTHERSLVTRAFLGSVAEDVLVHARQDVLIVPEAR